MTAVSFEEDDPLVEAVNRFAHQFALAYSTYATPQTEAGVIEYNGRKRDEQLTAMTEAMHEVAQAIESAGYQIANAMMTIAREWEGPR